MTRAQTIGSVAVAAAAAFAIGAGVAAQQKAAPPDDGPVRDSRDAVVGFTKMAEIPGTPWRIHDGDDDGVGILIERPKYEDSLRWILSKPGTLRPSDMS